MSRPLLAASGVSKHFGGLTAIHKVSLDLVEGEILGLIGPNGAGKSTFFNAVCGHHKPSEGCIAFGDHDITGQAPHTICRLGLARTFQIVKPFANLSVVENVMVGAFLKNRAVSRAETQAREVLDLVGLTAYAERPANVLTTAGRKRLELARALATRPRLLLLDEVMAGLTPTESKEIVKLIQKIRSGGVTILIIEHVMKAIMALSDRVAVLHHGELIAVDSPEKISRDPEVVEAYLGASHGTA